MAGGRWHQRADGRADTTFNNKTDNNEGFLCSCDAVQYN